MIDMDVDIGNSRVKWRLRQDATILDRGAESHDASLMFGETLPWSEIGRVNVACVAQPEQLERICQAVASSGHAKLFIAKTEGRFGRLVNGYPQPSQLGVDRWLAMIAAVDGHSGASCVVDCGTAITVDFVDATGQHEGGYIIPGISLQKKILMQGTHAVKPGESLAKNLEPGITTSDCVNHGIFASLRCGLQGILAVSVLQKKYKVFLTGGDAVDLLGGVYPDAVFAPDLVMDGLAVLAKAEV